MSALEAAKEFFAKAKDMAQETLKEAIGSLPEDVRKAFYGLRKDSYFVPENADLEHRREVLSPSGKYKLVVTPFTTGKGSWSYTQGLVYTVGSDHPIAEIRRNYHSFWHVFVEDHPSGHDYLVCGEDYQGQTVIELDTGRREALLPEAAKKGFGFCWISAKWIPSMQALLVDGCFWACPYEFRFYDFSDPMNGWPQIGADICIDADDRDPELQPDGTIKVFQTEYVEDDGDDEEEKLGPIAAYTVYRREGPKLVEVEAWVSEKEQEKRRQNEEASKKFEEWYADFKKTDPLYLTVLERVKNPLFTSEQYNSIGQTHVKWCPDFTKNERRMCRRIVKQDKLTIDLEWATDTGPIKLVICKDGKHVEDKFFYEHSPDSMNAAFDYAEGLLS